MTRLRKHFRPGLTLHQAKQRMRRTFGPAIRRITYDPRSGVAECVPWHSRTAA